MTGGIGPEKPAAAPRVVRVFVSSTFLDMQAEREELAKRVFPQLRRMCERRAVTWGEVDLRWGITDEEKAEGRVLPICLAEIERCRPFFIGILGERYGWIPPSLSQDLVRKHPWLATEKGRSVTELEIVNGVLQNPLMADRAFFYLRSAAAIEALPPEQQRLFVGDSPEAAALLADLKARVQSSGRPCREGFTTAAELGRLVLEDLRGAIDLLFPAGAQPDSEALEAAAQQQFADSRRRIWVAPGSALADLDEFAASDGPPLALIGPAGMGKSALLANWAKRYAAAHPDTMVVTHFVGSTPASADPASAVDRLVELSAAHGRRLLVVDGLDHFDPDAGGRGFGWLPRSVPAGLRLVMSLRPGTMAEEFVARDWPTYAMPALSLAERRAVVEAYLSQYGKSLDRRRAERIAEHSAAANPTFLRTLLEELRLWGHHETLDEHLERQLGVDDLPTLLDSLLARLERDYDDPVDLVPQTLALLALARRGLSERELVDLLGDGEPLPRAKFSPLFLAIQPFLVDVSGFLRFADEATEAAVRRRYVADEAAERAAHRHLADYFGDKAAEAHAEATNLRAQVLPEEVRRRIDAGQVADGGRPGVYVDDLTGTTHVVSGFIEADLLDLEADRRLFEELPWHLLRGGDIERLAELLAQPWFLRASLVASRTDLSRWCGELGRRAPGRLPQALLGALAHAPEDFELGVRVAEILMETGGAADAAALWAQLAEQVEAPEDRLACLVNCAAAHDEAGDPAKAINASSDAVAFGRSTYDSAQLAGALFNQGNYLGASGESDRAVAAYREAETLYRELGDTAGIARALGGVARSHTRAGNPISAIPLLDEQAELCRAADDVAQLADCLGERSMALRELGDFAAAEDARARAARLREQLGDDSGAANDHLLVAVLRGDRGDLRGARAAAADAERLARRVADAATNATSLRFVAAIHADQGRPADAERVAADALRLYLDAGDHAAAAECKRFVERVQSVARPEAGDKIRERRLLALPFTSIGGCWDYRVGVIKSVAAQLEVLSPADRPSALDELREVVTSAARELPPGAWATAAYVMAEDVYRSISATSGSSPSPSATFVAADGSAVWSPAIAAYLEATAGAFCAVLSERSLAVQYAISNTCESLTGPVELFPRWFEAAGFVYVCPQKIAAQLLEHDGGDPQALADELPQYDREARDVAQQLIERCQQERRHFVVFDADDGPEKTEIESALRMRETPGVVCIYRYQPPLVSQSMVWPPPGTTIGPV